MKINILYEDEYLIVLVKPSGVLVHPTLANEKNTLVSWLINNHPNIEKLSWPDKTRIGVVHRLDKDTSGILLMAKTPDILDKLQEQFKNHKIQKYYSALVWGKVEEKEGKIEATITRGDDGLQKIQETVYSFSKNKFRPAITFYKVVKHYLYDNIDLTLLEVKPKTGRMHQIRVHLKYINHPIIGDPLYNTKYSRKLSKELSLNRQFLHASKIEFFHPKINRIFSYESDSPDDLRVVLKKLGEK